MDEKKNKRQNKSECHPSNCISLKVIIFAFIFVIESVNSNAQKNDWPKHQIKFSPVRTINWFSPGLELSYELSYRRLSTQLSAAYLTDIFNTIPRGSDFSGYRLNLEEKFILKTFVNKKIRSYLSTEIGYNNIDMIVESEFRYVGENEEKEDPYYWDKCNLHRESIIGNFKYGTQFRTKHIIFDVSIGLGVIHQNVKHSNKRNPDDIITAHYEDLITPLFYDEGKYFVFNFPISVKIGYTF